MKDRHHVIRLTQVTGLRGRWGIARAYDTTLGGMLLMSLMTDEQHYRHESTAAERARELNRAERAKAEAQS